MATRLPHGAVNIGFRVDSTISVVNNGAVHENLAEDEIYDIVDVEEPQSQKQNNTREMQPAFKRIKKARSSIPTEMAPGVPDVLLDHTTGKVQPYVSGKKQIPIRDDVCANTPENTDNSKQPPSSVSNYDEIHNQNSSVKRSDSTSDPDDDDYLRLLQIPPEPDYLKLHPHLKKSVNYTNLDSPTSRITPTTAYYVNARDIKNLSYC